MERCLEIFQALIDHRIGFQELCDFIIGLAIAANEFGARGHINAIDIGEADARCGTCHKDFLSARLLCHADNFTHRRAAHNRVVH